LLVVTNILVYMPGLRGYFLADDFVHIPYLYQVFHGHPDLILKNFYSNWMSTSGTQFYRPLISITLAGDYMLWGVNAFGYHLTNVLYQIAASVFFFLFVRAMLRLDSVGADCIRPDAYNTRLRDADLAAFFSAGIFTVSPLHAEVVSWIIGRVDGVCTAFYLAAAWLFVKSFQRPAGVAFYGCLICFWASLFSKEMAVTLPPTLTLLCLTVLSDKLDLRSRLVQSFKSTAWLWAALAIYLLLRTAALGTITGGYSGSIGEGLSASFLKRFVLDGAFLKILLPLNGELYHPGSMPERLLKALYAAAGCLLLVRLALKQCRTKTAALLAFAGGWFVLALAPTYQVFNLSDTLFGSRFIYLATAPLSLFLAALAFPLSESGATPLLPGSRTNLLLRKSAIFLLCSFMAVSGAAAYRNNLPWAEAGRAVRALRQAIEEKLAQLEPEQKLVVLNIPQRHKGAHMIYNAAMLSVLLSPPLSTRQMYDRVVTFEPINYGEPDLINVSRLRYLLDEPQKYIFCRWDEKECKLVPVELTQAKPGGVVFGGLNLTLDSKGYLLTRELTMPAASVDFVDISLSCNPTDAGRGKAVSTPVAVLSWAGEQELLPSEAGKRLALPVLADGKIHTYRFLVSEHKSWLGSACIKRLRLDFSPGYSYSLRQLALTNAEQEIPKLTIDQTEMQTAPSGVTYLKDNTARFSYDASSVNAACGIALELSKPNCWFEHYTGSFRDCCLSGQAMHTWRSNHLRGQATLSTSVFPAAGYYQIRLAALASDGKVTGYVSDPIDLQISQAQIETGQRKDIVWDAE
jgi:hypothetical protein